MNAIYKLFHIHMSYKKRLRLLTGVAGDKIVSAEWVTLGPDFGDQYE